MFGYFNLPYLTVAKVAIGLCTIEFYLPDVASLKEKRGILKPMLSRIHKTFNVSASEIGQQNEWQAAIIGIAVVSNSSTHNHRTLNTIVDWIEENFPDAQIVRQDMEML